MIQACMIFAWVVVITVFPRLGPSFVSSIIKGEKPIIITVAYDQRWKITATVTDCGFITIFWLRKSAVNLGPGDLFLNTR